MQETHHNSAGSAPHVSGAAALVLREFAPPDLLPAIQRQVSLDPAITRPIVERMRAELAATTTYIPSMIVRQHLQHPAPGQVFGAIWEGSLLFADLSGFTALSGQLSELGKQGAEEISAIINGLFAALLEEIDTYSGSLLKFGGDALTVFFHAEMLGADHAALAARAALAMQACMQASFGALDTRAGTFQLRLRIGVHSGRVFAAQVGDLEHIELVVTGHDVNRVALAQEIAEPGEVVVSDSTLQALDGPDYLERRAGFYLLHAFNDTIWPPRRTRTLWPVGVGDTNELFALAERIAALRPYLPRGLPRRFLESAPGASETGEFRPVSVLFANFADFSHLLDLLPGDPATAVQVLNAYYRRAQAVIHRYDGIVNKVDMYTHGDKLMALFGAPLAHEDDPERAALAALELCRALDEANTEISTLLPGIAFQFSQKIGINTGVVFGGKVGSTRRHEYTVMGQPVNLSARLMSVAASGSVVVSPSTRRAIERSITLHELPPVRLKGVVDPVPIAELLRPRDAIHDTRRHLFSAALVARDEETRRVVQAAYTGLNGQGRVIALTGEAGLGKTRLIEETLQKMVLLSGDQESGIPVFQIYGVDCQSYEQNTSYATIRALLTQVFSLRLYTTTDAMVAAVVRRVHELVPSLERFTPTLSDILGLPIEDSALTAALSPEQRHERAVELVTELVRADAQAYPLVLVVDDLQWADASSLELLEHMAATVVDAPALLLFSYRAEQQVSEPWKRLEHCVALPLRELSPEGTAELAGQLLGGVLPGELRTLLERTQGNPFFIEEMLHNLVEAGSVVQEDGAWKLARPLEEVVLPDRVEGLIIARLDRLDDTSREVVHVASVIGRRFTVPVLNGVIARNGEVRRQLESLSTTRLITPEDIEQGGAYVFRQALTRDVAYETILYARRRDLHRRVAQQIETQQREHLDDYLALLARHYLLAEDWVQAFDYHVRAGRLAQKRFANREAITLLERALDVLPRLAEQPAGQDIELNERLGWLHGLIGEYDTALMHYQAALEQVRARADVPLEGQVRLHHHIARVYEQRAEFDTAFTWVDQAMNLAGLTRSLEQGAALPASPPQSVNSLVRCVLLGAGLHLRQGRYAQAIEWAARALEMSRSSNNLRDQAQALKILGNTYVNMGENTRAYELLSESLAIYQQAQDLDGLAYAHNDLANIYYELGRLDDARTHYEAAAELKQMIGDIYGQALIANNLGDLLKLRGDLEGATEQFETSLAHFQRIGSQYGTGVLNMNLGATLLLRNDPDGAEGYLRNSAAMFERIGAEDFLPELKRYQAELAFQRGDLEAARRACEESLADAARLEARSEEGSTRRILARVLAATGQLTGAWEELQRSLTILREAETPHEIARTLIEQATLAPYLNRTAEGQSALDEAIQILYGMGARYDLEAAYTMARTQGYVVSS